MNDPELAWRVWTWMEGMSWQHLPCAGGLLDQPEALMDDLATISRRKSQIKEMLKNPAIPGAFVRT